MRSNEATWPELDYAEWQDSCATLHLLTQIVGKIRLAHAPLVNHWWQVPLYVTSRGLTTSAMPHGARNFQIDFDFIDHQLRIEASDGRSDSIPLIPRPVADFYADLMGRLRALDLETHLWTMPVEIADRVAFEEDRVHRPTTPSRSPGSGARWYRSTRCSRCSARAFSARPARCISSGAASISRSPGFRDGPPRFTREPPTSPISSPVKPIRPGNGGFGRPAFYSYAYPQPAGFADAAIAPPGAFYSKEIAEFILPYDAVRQAPAPRDLLLDFLESTYQAAANLGKWDRAALERSPG